MIIPTFADVSVAARQLILDEAQVACELGIQPDDTGWQGVPNNSEFVPYVVLHRVDAGLDGSISEPHEDTQLVYQPTCVGITREQAERVQDAVRQAFMDPVNWVIEGRYVTLVSVDEINPVTVDPTVEPAVHIATDRYRVHVVYGS